MERELRKEEWPAFFDAFSRDHAGSLVTLDCDRVGCAFLDMPLRSIVATDCVVEVFALAPDGAHVTHVVRRPSGAFAGDMALTIENNEGKRTVIKYRKRTTA